MKKLLMIGAIIVLAGCKSLYICEPEALDTVVLSAGSAESMFELNSYELKPASKKTLDTVAAKMKKDTKLNAKIKGYTDNTGAESYNVTLSQKRAQAVADYITSKGVMADRLTVKGYGPKNPVASNDTHEGRAQNRRVEISYK